MDFGTIKQTVFCLDWILIERIKRPLWWLSIYEAHFNCFTIVLDLSLVFPVLLYFYYFMVINRHYFDRRIRHTVSKIESACLLKQTNKINKFIDVFTVHTGEIKRTYEFKRKQISWKSQKLKKFHILIFDSILNRCDVLNFRIVVMINYCNELCTETHLLYFSLAHHVENCVYFKYALQRIFDWKFFFSLNQAPWHFEHFLNCNWHTIETHIDFIHCFILWLSK